MTCIVAVAAKSGTVFMGADALASGGCTGTVRRGSKIVRRSEMLIGVSGDIHLEQALRHLFSPVAHNPGTADMTYLVRDWIPALRRLCQDQGIKCGDHDEKDNVIWHLLVAYRGHIYEVDDDFQIIEPSVDYAAVGCARDVALGSLYTTTTYAPNLSAADRVRAALEAAQEHDLHTQGPFFIDGTE